MVSVLYISQKQFQDIFLHAYIELYRHTSHDVLGMRLFGLVSMLVPSTYITSPRKDGVLSAFGLFESQNVISCYHMLVQAGLPISEGTIRRYMSSESARTIDHVMTMKSLK